MKIKANLNVEKIKEEKSPVDKLTGNQGFKLLHVLFPLGLNRL